MTMIRTLILGITLLLTAVCYGQRPITSGYLGKTTYVNIRFATGLTLNHPQKARSSAEFLNEGSAIGQHSLKKEFEIIGGKVLSNHVSIEGNFGAHNTSMNLGEYFSGYYTLFPLNINQIHGSPKVTDRYIGLKVKLYARKKGAIAPLGFYNGFQLNMHRYKSDFTDVDIFVEGGLGNSVLLDYDQRIWRNSGVDFNWTMGMNRAVGERILLDFGVSTGLSLNVSESPNGEYEVLDQLANQKLKNMLLRYNLNKVYFGVGYLF